MMSTVFLASTNLLGVKYVTSRGEKFLVLNYILWVLKDQIQ